MRYKIMVKGTAYKAARTAKLYTAQIYRAVSIKLIITLPDGSPVSGQQITVDGANYETDSAGQIILTDDMGTSTTYRVKYSDIYYTDVDVTYTKDATYDVKLE